jgi:hypothetical protein
LSVDVTHRRLGLSLRQVHNNGNGVSIAPNEIMTAPEDQP